MCYFNFVTLGEEQMEEKDSTGNQCPGEEMMVEISVQVSMRTKIRAFLVPKDIPEEER